MKTLHRMFAAVVLALVAPFLLVVPAHAAEPDPLTTCQSQLDNARAEAEYWKGVYVEGGERASAELTRVVDERNLWQARSTAYAQQLGQRTAERDRLRGKVNRLTTARARLQAKVADLRAELRGEPTSR